MPETDRILFNILCKDIEAAAGFYEKVAGLQRIYNSDWYIVMSPPTAEALQIGLIDEVHEVAPTAARGMSNGSYLTLVVQNLDEALEAARQVGAQVLEEPQELFYGQRRALIRDPNDVVVDLSQPV